MPVLCPLALVLAAGVALPAAAAETRTSLTVYSRDLAFVREPRLLELTGSRDTLRLADVAEHLDVASVRLTPEAGRVTRLAYRYDVASVDALLDRARGSRVRVTMRGDRAIEGTLVTADGSWIVLRENDGGVRTLARGSVDDVSLPDAPRLLVTRPMLEAVVEGTRRGRVPAQLSYLTGGLSWSAEHVLVRTGETAGSWSSAVTVDNSTGRDFQDVSLRLVAGEPRRIAPPPMPVFTRMAALGQGAAEKAADLSEETFSEYHLYSLDRPATLRDREVQQLTMLEPRAVTMSPRYLYRGAEGGGVRAQLELKNDAASGLGMALPAGRVRVFEPDALGELQFTGETLLGHTATGEKLTLDVGAAFDLVGERRETSNRRISDREREYAVEIKLRNRKPTAVSIVVEETLAGDTQILQQSQDFVRKDANTIQCRVPVGANKESVVTYTARVRY